ncbi:hypothetical protein [Xanthobacter autotrophicus]|uniref:hypothetical protein n=1 Tax=Xanthobacter autotrophicus TaxID=280 RepID=UPI003726E056
MVPEEYLLGDRALYLSGVNKSMPIYSRSGVIPVQRMKSALAMRVKFDPELKAATIGLAKTFDDRFVARAAAGGK